MKRNALMEECRELITPEIREEIDFSVNIHHCKLVPYGNEEKRCIKCGYVTWNSNKPDNEIIQDMINAGYSVPYCDNNI